MGSRCTRRWWKARDRERLETLCRHAGRPAVAESRLVELADGRFGYVLKKRWRDGTTHVVTTTRVLMEQLCAPVPRQRRHLVTFHGALAPAGLRWRWRRSERRTLVTWTDAATRGLGSLLLFVRTAADLQARGGVPDLAVAQAIVRSYLG